MSAGLAASTVTPGMTAPDASRATPAIALASCAHAAGGSRPHATSTTLRLMTTGLTTTVLPGGSQRFTKTRDANQMVR